jgi:N-acetylglucosaminyl-diphospho-decaprenol L-rhamnosyltransferase
MSPLTSMVDGTAAPTVAGHARCAVVLVCWNNKAYLEPCLRSLFDARMRHACEVVVVDNGSTDGSQAMLRESFPSVHLVQNEGNVGLGKASNQGIECTTAPFVLLLNNDTIVDGPSLDALIDFMEATPDAGAVGGTLLNPDGSFQAGWNHFPSLTEEFLIASRLGEFIRQGYPTVPGGQTPRAVDWITSACLLVRRAALAEVGLLDESYFIYGDETDLQCRLARAGWKVYHVPAATTVHFGGRSMDRWRRRKMVYRGKMLFYRKQYGAARTAVLRAVLGLLTLGKLVVWSLAWPVPSSRERAAREMASNVDVLRLCLRLE